MLCLFCLAVLSSCKSGSDTTDSKQNDSVLSKEQQKVEMEKADSFAKSDQQKFDSMKKALGLDQ